MHLCKVDAEKLKNKEKPVDVPVEKPCKVLKRGLKIKARVEEKN